MSIRTLAPLLAALSLIGCGGGPPSPADAASLAGGDAPRPQVEAKIRKQTPISVCATTLPAPKATTGGKAVMRNLDPEEWLPILIPQYTRERGLVAQDLDCTGQYAFANESLRGGLSLKGWPRKVDPDEMDLRSGPDGMRVVWLRALKYENGDEGGPIALVRGIDDRAEVYGIGSYRGTTKTKFSPVRLGTDNLVVAEAKICPEPDDCRKQAYFYLVRRGRLIQAAVVDVERTAILPSLTERGLYARYTLRTDISYQPNQINLLEQVLVQIVHDESGTRDSDRKLHKAEFSRSLRVERDALFSTNDPLWERVVGQD